MLKHYKISLILIITSILLSAAEVAGQQFFPKGLTPEEKADYQHFIHTYEYGDKSTNPPSAPPRTPAEFEEAGGLILSWTAYSEELREIVRHAKKRVPVHIISNNATQVQSYLEAGDISMDNIFIQELPFNSVWVRDYGPQSVYLDGSDELAFVDWLYNRPHRPDDNMLPVNLAGELGYEVFQMTASPNRLVATGGNFMTDGHGTGFSSRLIMTENPGLTESQVDEIKHQYMGIDRYIKMDELPYDNISHLDMHMKLLDEETLLVAEFPEGISDGPYIENNLEYLLTNHQSSYERDFSVVRIPMVSAPNGNYPPQAHYRTFTNSLILNDLVLVPQYYNTTLNNEALEIYRQAMPGYDIVGINMENVIPASGAIHCITREIAAHNPIFIAHAPARMDTVEATEFSVKAEARSAAGIEKVSVWYSMASEEQFTQLPMEFDGETYSAAIPRLGCGEKVEYYISATDGSGKTIHKPLVAPANLYAFVFRGKEKDFSASKRVAAPQEEITFSFNGCLDHDLIEEITWNFGEDASPATAADKMEQEVFFATEGHKTITLIVNGEEIIREQYILVTGDTENVFNLAVDVQGQGSVNPAPGDYYYNEGSFAQLHAEASEGWTFDHWRILPDETTFNEPSLSLTIDQDMTAIAVFEQIATYVPRWESKFLFDVFPNPSRGLFTLVISPTPAPVNLQIFNMHGRRVHQEKISSTTWDKSIPINLQHEAAGVYFLRLDGEHGTHTKKIILR